MVNGSVFNLIATRHEAGMKCTRRALETIRISLANPLHVVRTLLLRTTDERRDEGGSAAHGAKKCRFAISANTPPGRGSVTDVRPFSG